MKEILDRILPNYPPNKNDGLLPILQEIQKECGYLTDEILSEVGKYLNMPANKVYGVATFYDQFRFKPRGQFHIRLCKGTACYLHGSATYLNELEKQLRVKAGTTSRDGKFSLEVAHCLGACESAPVMRINDAWYPKVSPQELSRIIRSLKEKTV
ncbi:MAG: NADH-quinone oxidoreductase subunit NuoE [Bacteroidetes bacterium]|nr:NADH-quinone oxidoreductase subunit NuoE [Bacteroidota bacterium]